MFVSNKVKYNLVYDNLVRTDYKSDFNNIFLSLSDINSRFNEYSEICKNILKVEEDEAMRFEQRVSMLSERNGQRAYISKNLKSTVMSIINSFKKKLDKLLLDKEEREKIIANPNDILTLFADIGNHKKRVQGYNVLKALTEAYYFISGFNYLITEGELSGAGILIDKAEETIEENKEEKDDKEDKKEEEIKENKEEEIKENNEDDNEVNNTEENEKEINNDKEENIDTLVSDNIDEDVKDM